MSNTWALLKKTIANFGEDDCMSLAGALAFYTALSLAPLLILLLRIASLLGEEKQAALISKIQEMVGPQAAEAVSMVIDSAGEQPGWGTIAGIVSLLILLFSATGVFAQLQASLNRIWDVEPRKSEGIKGFIRKRLLSAGMILAIAFLLLVSLVASSIIGIIIPQGAIIWQWVDLGVSLCVFILLFGLMYKYLPDVKIAWRDVWLGATVTAVLFAIGKFGVVLYLAHSSTASSYGAAGSLLVLLLWVYYSSLLVFLGAEFTQAYARQRGRAIEPDEHAQWARDAKHLRPA